MRLATLAALRVRTITTQRLKWMTANPPAANGLGGQIKIA